MTTPDDIDRALADLRQDADALAANLLELELDDTRKLLDAVHLTGATAARWSQVSAATLEAWRAHALLLEQLQRADELRAEHSRIRPEQLAALAEIVDGASIELAPRERISPRDLIAQLTPVVDDALRTVNEVATVWASFTPRLEAARDAYDALSAPMDGALPAEAAQLASRADELDRLTAILATDPLSLHGADIDALAAQLRAADQDRGEIAALRQEASARLAAARELMERIEAAQRDGETAHELVLAKIAGPSVPEPVHVLSELDAELRSIEQLVETRAWRDAHDGLVRWTTNATAALERATAVADQNRAPLDQRNELRGRLKAYQAKARDLRALEDPSVTDLFDRARDALYGSPTDLDAAARLVGSYRDALAQRTELSR